MSFDRFAAAFDGWKVVPIERDGEITRLIPWRRKSERGTPVELVNKVTPPSQIERDLFASCSALMEQV